MKKIVIKKHNNLIWALTGLMMSGTLIDFTNVLTLLALGQKISIFETIIDAVCIFLICLDLPKIISKKFRFVCGSTLVFLTAWFFSGLIFPENTKYLLENSKQFFVYVLPYCWIGYYLNTENYLIKDF